MRPHCCCLPTSSRIRGIHLLSHHQACSTAIDFQAFLVAPLGHRLATTVTDAHLRNSNHHKDLREAKTQEWRVMMTGRNNSACPQGALKEVVEAADLHDSCGPSRALEATHTLLATCMYN